jgi:hypothetical protein
MQVGFPHCLQFVLGVSLNMSSPLSAILFFLPYISSLTNFATVATDAGCLRITAFDPEAWQASSSRNFHGNTTLFSGAHSGKSASEPMDSLTPQATDATGVNNRILKERVILSQRMRL